MRYKPRNSNFAELQDEFADDVIQACRSNNPLEQLKDYVAETIDSYLDAIIKEHLAERKFMAVCGKEPMVWFLLGENNRPDGVTDMFFTETTLRALLDDLNPEEIDEVEHAGATALILEKAAARFREREAQIPKEDAELASCYGAVAGSARVAGKLKAGSAFKQG